MVDIGAHADLRKIDSSCRLLGEVLDAVSSAADLRADMILELSAELTAAQDMLTREIADGNGGDEERAASIEVVRGRMSATLQHYAFARSAFGDSGGGDGNNNNADHVPRIIHEVTRRAQRKSIHER